MSVHPFVDGNVVDRNCVVIMVDTFPGLSETFVVDQIDALRSRGLNVRIVAGYRNKSGLIQEKARQLSSEAFYAEDRMGPVRLLPLIIRRRIYPLAWQRRIYRPVLENAGLVLCHFGPVGRRAALALRDIKGPKLWTIFHGYDMSSYLRYQPNAYAQLFQRGDRFLGVSRLWTRRLSELGCPQERIGLLRMGIDVDRIHFAARSVESVGRLRLLTVGRLVEKKGTEYALRALAALAQLRPSLDWSFEIVGEGRRRRPLERLTRNLAIDERVTFAGKLPAKAVQERLSSSDIFILPSVTASNGDMEGIPVSIMEAMASGAPVLSTRHSGIPELIEHGVSGLLAAERDVEELTRNLCTLIDRPDLRSSIAEAARKRVELEFNQDTISTVLAEEIRLATSETL